MQATGMDSVELALSSVELAYGNTGMEATVTSAARCEDHKQEAMWRQIGEEGVRHPGKPLWTLPSAQARPSSGHGINSL